MSTRKTSIIVPTLIAAAKTHPIPDARTEPFTTETDAVIAVSSTAVASTTRTIAPRNRRGSIDALALRGTSQTSSIADSTAARTPMPPQSAPTIPTTIANTFPSMEWMPLRIWVPMMGRFASAESTIRAWSCSLPCRAYEVTVTTRSINGNNEKKP